ERTTDAAVKILPEIRQSQLVHLAFVAELLLIGDSGPYLLFQIIVEFGLEIRIGELFGENGGESEGDVRRDAFGDEPIKHVQQRNVGLGGALRQPVHAVRPASMREDV